MAAKKKRSTKETVEAIKEATTSGRQLTLKQEAFINAYLETGNATQAYRRAYDADGMSDEAIRVEAHKLLKHPNIALRLESFKQSAVAETMLTLEAHMSELRTLRELAKQNAQISAAIKAEELRGKLRRFYVEQIEHGDAHAFDQMSDDELRQFVAEETKAMKLNARPAMNGNGSGTKH